MIKGIKNLNDVSTFFYQLFEEGTNAHPDDDFSQYINTETSEPAYTDQDAVERNTLMQQSFEICEAAEADIYDLMQEIYLKETGLNQFIPLPSASNPD